MLYSAVMLFLIVVFPAVMLLLVLRILWRLGSRS